MNDDDLSQLFRDLAAPVAPVPGRASTIVASASRRRAYTQAGLAAAVVAIVATFAAVRPGSSGPSGQTTPTLTSPSRPVAVTPAPVATPVTSLSVTPAPVATSPVARATSVRPPSVATTGPASWRIAYQQDSTSVGAGIEVRDGDGRLVQHVNDLSLDGLALSRDGQLLAYVSVADGEKMVVRHSDGSGVPVTVSTSYSASSREEVSVAPDDNRLMVEDGQGMLLVTLRPRGSTRLLTVTGSGSGVFGLTWAPDGKSLAFITSGNGVRIPGGAALAADTVYLWDGTFHRESTGSHALALAWSAAGHLAFLTSDGALRVVSDKARVVATLPALDRYGSEPSLSWSPDSSRLAFTVFPGPLKLIDVATHSVRVVPQPGSDLRVVWLPDGDLLVTGYDTPHPNAATPWGAPKIYDQTGHLLRRLPNLLTPDWEFAFGAPSG